MWLAMVAGSVIDVIFCCWKGLSFGWAGWLFVSEGWGEG
jgi:hypothetical protein